MTLDNLCISSEGRPKTHPKSTGIGYQNKVGPPAQSLKAHDKIMIYLTMSTLTRSSWLVLSLHK
jgi:hypothetical protein